ncbi:hypothetical protein [Bradyrhizobium sp. th.b2]|uniref:hypothetical protein n=1 Tax=Bradyrhizobium sp. th-b2 TaxID=172088 RepID=UPI00048CE37D|nr:hypothetical protein [Bradyrhizobium sp. th.b2]
MFNKPIVLAVGAGASYDQYKLPLGGELAAGIARDTGIAWDDDALDVLNRGSRDLLDNFFRTSADSEAILAAAKKLSYAMASTISIDDALFLLSEHPECVKVGKLCIMRAILMAEASSPLRVQSRKGLAHDAGRDGWIEQIFSMAITGYKLSQIVEHAFKNITFVIFNYDRCVEHYLFWSLRRLEVTLPDAQAAIENLNIIRPYGGLRPIFRDSGSNLVFGAAPQQDLWDRIGRIRTFTESEVLHDGGALSKALSNAQMILFLGFGFHPQNLELLSLGGPHPNAHVKVLATTFGVHEANIPELKKASSKTLHTSDRNIETHPMTASEILTKLRPKINLALG